MDALLLIVGQQIKSARTNLNITQEELAQKCGMRTADIFDIEDGNHNISLLTLQKLTNAIDMEIRLNLEEMFPDPNAWKKFEGNFNGIKAWIITTNDLIFKVILHRNMGLRVIQNFDGTPWHG